jgi:membrane associated rhomboid family serine protease
MAYTPDGSLVVDRCIQCKGVWLDESEIRKVRRVLAKKLILHRRMRHLDEAVRREQEMWETYTAGVAEEEQRHQASRLEWLFMFLTHLPVEVYNPARRIPPATIGLMVANILTFGLQKMNPNITATYAFVPTAFSQLTQLYNIVIAMFLHANLLHLAGNLYFLYTFGDNVEDFLGGARFTLLYFVCGIFAHLFLFATNTHSAIPVIGASGAISGIFAAYMLLYPRRKIYLFVIIWPVKIRAIWYGLGWVALQAFSATMMSSLNVAWWGHIGGFVTGVVAVETYLKYEHVYPATTSA